MLTTRAEDIELGLNPIWRQSEDAVEVRSSVRDGGVAAVIHPERHLVETAARSGARQVRLGIGQERERQSRDVCAAAVFEAIVRGECRRSCRQLSSGHVGPKSRSQYSMYTQGLLFPQPSVSKTNCCQPAQPCTFAALLHAGVRKLFVLSWSEKELALPVAESVTLATSSALSNEPAAMNMGPFATSATKSLPLPPVWGRGPLVGRWGRGSGVAQGTSFHLVLGYAAVKHPTLREGARDMIARHFSHFS